MFMKEIMKDLLCAKVNGPYSLNGLLYVLFVFLCHVPNT